MNGMLIEAKATSFVMKDVPMPIVGDDDVLISLRAAALNHRDIFIQQGLYPRSKFPIIIGSDGAGVVVDVGKNISRSLLNTEVVINPSLNWGSNPNFSHKEYKILGFPDSGTLAEFVGVPARLVHPKPKHLSWEEAAAIPLAALTAYRGAFTKGNVRAGEQVLITGIGGGVALFALQFALAVGARVLVTSSSEEKIRKAIALGATAGVNYKTETWVDELQNISNQRLNSSSGFELIIDGAVGSGFARLLDVAAPGARIVLYGSTQGKIQNAEPARIFWKQLSILGTTMGTDEEFVAMLQFIEHHNIKPVIDTMFPLEDAEKAIRRMASGEQFGKIVLRHPSQFGTK